MRAFPAMISVLASAGALLACTTTTTSSAAPPSTGATSGAKPSSGGPVVLPGACVDPVADARARMGGDADADGVKRAVIDLDVDGAPDVMVSHESFCGTGGCSWQLYVLRGACGHYVGELFAVLPIADSTKHLGLADLEVTVRNGCAGLARTELHTHFDGKEYVA